MKHIPYGRQWIDNDDIREVVKTLKSDWITQGPKIAEFERELCKYTGAKYAAAVSSGTAALHLACLAARIRKDDEVITSPITFAASANCVLYCGGKPVFADIEQDTANIDPRQIQKNITKNTKALIPVHYAGHPCNMESIHKIAKENKLIVIEDACHALGAQYYSNGKWIKVGSCKHSDMAVLSFHPVKHITTGEGGAILTNNKVFYERIIALRTHGITKERLINPSHGGWYYEMQELGYNYRITDIQCALGISQMKKLGKFVKRRREIAASYNKRLRNITGYILPVQKEYACSSWHLYPLQLKENVVSAKKKIFSNLKKSGIGVQVHYIPVYMHPYYLKQGYKKGICPNAEAWYKREISIPIYPAMNKSHINTVIKKLSDCLR